MVSRTSGSPLMQGCWTCTAHIQMLKGLTFLWKRKSWGHAWGSLIYKISGSKEQTRSLKEAKEFPHEVISLIRTRKTLSPLIITCLCLILRANYSRKDFTFLYPSSDAHLLNSLPSTDSYRILNPALVSVSYSTQVWPKKIRRIIISEINRDKMGLGACTIAFHEKKGIACSVGGWWVGYLVPHTESQLNLPVT